MVIGDVRCSYAHVFEASETPSGDMKFSVCGMIPKTDKALLKRINDGIQEAVKKGLEKNTFTKAQVKSLRLPLRDGDEEHEAGDRGPEFKGMMFFNCNSKDRPGVVEKDSAGGFNEIMDANGFFSGCWAKLDVNFFPYNTAGNRGIGVGLNNVMKVKEDERLDGKQSAESAFSEFAEAADEADLM